MIMGWDSCTLWLRDGASWRRVVVTGCRVERQDGADAATVGPRGARSLRVFLVSDPGLRPGDYAADGVRAEAEPPEGSRRVSRVDRWSARGGLHHVEVTCE